MANRRNNVRNSTDYTDYVSLREYITDKIKATEDKIALNLKLNQVAQDKADAKLDIRLEGMNEIRSQLDRQARTFITKPEYEAKHELLMQKIETLQKFMWLVMGAIAVLEVILRFFK
jgi:hypothetical protein